MNGTFMQEPRILNLILSELTQLVTDPTLAIATVFSFSIVEKYLPASHSFHLCYANLNLDSTL